MELKAYQAYKNPELSLYYWRTSTGQEVDFILGEMEVAIEIKTSTRIHESDCRGLKALASSHKVKKLLLVSFESEPKKMADIQCLPWQIFLQLLWDGQIV